MKPGSTTYTIPSIVIDDSAILVATTIFLPFIPLGLTSGGGSKIFSCKYGGKVEYIGTTLAYPTSSPNSSIPSLIC